MEKDDIFCEFVKDANAQIFFAVQYIGIFKPTSWISEQIIKKFSNYFC
jgi:hypothetical protein